MGLAPLASRPLRSYAANSELLLVIY